MADRLSSDGGGGTIPNSFHHHRRHNHHHHFFYVSPHCPLHRPILQPQNHAPSCQFSTSSGHFHPNPRPVASTQPGPDSGFAGAQTIEELDDAFMMIEDEAEIGEVDEEEEEPIFVLTDEWREFFAKSEAKRKLAKKQAKKGKN